MTFQRHARTAVAGIGADRAARGSQTGIASSGARASHGPRGIGLWRGDDRRENLRRALSIVIDDIDWDTRQRVVVKPNLVTPQHPLSITHPDALDEVLGQIRRRYDGALAVAEGCAVMPTHLAMSRLGMDTIAARHGASVIDLNGDEPVAVRAFDQSGRLRDLHVARTVVDSDCRVSLAVPKTHDTVLVTLAIKNLVMGALVNRKVSSSGMLRWGAMQAAGRLVRWPRLPFRLQAPFPGRNDKTAMHQGFEAINVNLALLGRLVWPDLAVLDGYEAMEGEGPCSGSAVPWRLAAAGTSALAVDGLVADLMGFPPESVGYLRHCVTLGLGVLAGDDGIVQGNVEPIDARRDFRPHRTARRQRGWDTPAAAEMLGRGMALDAGGAVLAAQRGRPEGEGAAEDVRPTGRPR